MESLRIVLEEPSPHTAPFFELGLCAAVAKEFSIKCSVKRSRPEPRELTDLRDDMRATLDKASLAGAELKDGLGAYVTGGTIPIQSTGAPSRLEYTIIAVTRGKRVIDAAIEPWGEQGSPEAAQLMSFAGANFEHIRPVSGSTAAEKHTARVLMHTLHTAMEQVRDELEGKGRPRSIM